MSLNESIATDAHVSESVVSSISTIQSFKELDEEIVAADQETLVILDVDYTLFQPPHPAFQQGNFAANKDFVKSTLKSITSDWKSEFATSIATIGPGLLIEENIPIFVEKLHAKGAKVLVLSSILTGAWKSIPDIMSWRMELLTKAGIRTTDFGFKTTYQFKEFAAYRNNHPEINEGVLLTNGEMVSKSQALEALLDKIKWTPKTIIFIDDTKALLEDMAAYASQKGIAFKGYEYKGAKHALCEPISPIAFEAAWTDLIGSVNPKL